MTLIDRDGVRVAALVHDPSLDDEPELLDAVTAAAGIALENGRLHAELAPVSRSSRAPARGSSRPASKERQRLERNLHDGAQQRLIALSLELGLLEGRVGDDPDARQRLERARREIAPRSRSCAPSLAGSIPRLSAGTASRSRSSSSPRWRRSRCGSTVELEGRLPERARGRGLLRRLGEPRERRQARPRVGGDGRRQPRATARRRRVVDDGVGGADTERGSGLRGLADRVEALGGRLRIWTPLGGGTRVRAELPCGSRSPRTACSCGRGSRGCSPTPASRSSRSAADGRRAPARGA